MLLFIDFELGFCIQSMISCSDCYFLLHVELGFDLEVEWSTIFQLNWVSVRLQYIRYGFVDWFGFGVFEFN